MAIEIVSFPINSMVDLSIVMLARLPGRVYWSDEPLKVDIKLLCWL